MGSFKGGYRGIYRDIGGPYKGFKDPNNRVSGPKYFVGIWALKPYYLGPWNLRVKLHLQHCAAFLALLGL